jgi:RNA polymerase sigma-70 factor (ECF subfamily)
VITGYIHLVIGHTTHATLLARLSEGSDAAAWREFNDRYGELIRAFARMRGVQGVDCDDILQDVLMGLTKAMAGGQAGGGFQYDPQKGRFRSYLKTAVIHAIGRRSRQNRGAAGLETFDAPTEAEVENQWEQQWRQHHTRLAMKTVEGEFNATDIEAFKRYGVLQQDAGAVAASLGVSVESVYQAKSRVLKRLSKLIEQQVGEEG